MIMKMKYIKPVILCCYDIDMSIMTATGDLKVLAVSDSKAQYGDGLEFARPDDDVPTYAKGTSWHLWEDEEENSFY